MLEKDLQSSVIRELKDRFPGCIILKNDSSYKQGVPDLIILFEDKWATIECKNNIKAVHRPNQDYYVNLMNTMSFSAFLYPENRDDVISQLSSFFSSIYH